MPNPIQQMIVNLILERPGRKHTLAGWAEALAASGQDLSARFAAAPDTEANRRLVSHITGIERWGVSRLGVLLGAPLLQDKYDGYRPAQDLDWPAMQAAFAEHDAFQCGYCTPGQILSAIACIEEGHAGSADEIREYMSGNLCRCGAYPNIVAAIESVRDGKGG